VKRLIILLVLTVSACGGTAESSAPLAGDELLALGGDSYRTFCAACHGIDLRGTTLGPSFLSIVYEPNHHADFAFVSAAKNGVVAHHWGFGDMPAVPQITDQEITAVTAYVRSIQDSEGFDE